MSMNSRVIFWNSPLAHSVEDKVTSTLVGLINKESDRPTSQGSASGWRLPRMGPGVHSC